MINTDKINQLASNMPTNSRLPLQSTIHLMAFDDDAIKLLSSGLEVDSHITYVVIQPEQTYLLTNKLFQSVHCVIVEGIGVLLSSTCSAMTEGILENIAQWAFYLYPKHNVQFYARY